MVETSRPAEIEKMIGRSRVISDLISFPRSPLDFRFHVVTARVDESFESKLAESVARCVASGVSADPEIAVKAAIGEAWERVAFVDALDQLRRESPAAQRASFSQEDFHRLPFLLDRNVDRASWAAEAVESRIICREYHEFNRNSGEKIVKLPVGVHAASCRSSLFETTNGLACADSWTVGIDRAVREVVERDALMLVWLTKCGGRRVAPCPVLAPVDCQQIERMETMGVRTVVRDISTDFGIRVFLVGITAEFPGKRIGLAFGAGAHRSASVAASHAFKEACLSWRGVVWRSVTGDSPAAKDVPASFAAHGEYYSSWHRMHLLDYLLDADAPVHECECEANEDPDLRDTGHLDLLLGRGLSVFAADITPDQAADTDLCVVQAVIPGLIPLYLGDRHADQLAMQRLPCRIGGIEQGIPEALDTNVHPWP